jgi:hypothetical protein
MSLIEGGKTGNIVRLVHAIEPFVYVHPSAVKEIGFMSI